MAKPDTLIIDGHAFSWQRIVELRKQQVEAHRTAPCRQPALFELKGRHAPIELKDVVPHADRRRSYPPPFLTGATALNPT
jgi:hypothetical protein